MEILTVFLQILATIFFSGAGLAFSLLPEKNKNHLLLLAPFLGCILISLVAQNCSSFGIPVSKSIPWLFFVVFLSSLYLLGSIFRKLVSGLKSNHLLDAIQGWDGKVHCWAFVPSFFSALILLYPLLSIGYLTWFGGGTDSMGYIRYAYFLQNNSYPTNLPITQSEYPWYGWLAAVLHADFLGTSYMLSFLSSFLSRDPLEIFNLIMATFGFLTPLAVYLTLNLCFELEVRTSLIAATLVSLQSFWFLPGYTTFLNQFGGIPFFILLFGLFFFVVKEKSNQSYLLLSMIIALLVSYYSQVLAILAPSALILIVRGFRKKELSVKDFVKGGIWLVGIPILLNNYHFWQYIERGMIASQSLANHHPLPPFYQSLWQYLAVFLNIFTVHDNWTALLKLAAWLLIPSLLVCFGVSFFLLKGKLRSYFAATFFFFLAFALIPAVQGHGYGIWKVLTYTQFLFWIGVALALNYFWSRKDSIGKTKWVIFTLILCFSFLNLRSANKMTKHPFFICDKEMLELSTAVKKIKKELQSDDGVRILFPKNPSPHEWLSIIYVFREIPLIINESDSMFQHLIFTEFKNRVLRPKFWLYKIKGENTLPEVTQESIFWSNTNYAIVRR